MHRLTYRPCVHRQVTLFLPKTNRLESTTASQPSSTTRITSNWGGVVIPSRDDVLRKSPRQPSAQQRTTPYKHILSHLEKGPATNFAVDSGNETRQDVNSTPAVRKLPSLTQEQKHARQRRLDEITAQRRAERLVREEAMKRQTADPQEQTSAELKRRIDALTMQRRAERVAREEAAKQSAPNDVQQVLPGGMRKYTWRQGQQFEGTNIGFDQRSRTSGSFEHRNLPQSLSSRMRTGTSRRRPIQNGGAPSAPDGLIQRKQQPSISVQEESGDPSEEITLGILEQGGDDKEPAQFTSPDISFTILEDLFSPSAPARPDAITGAQTSSEEGNLGAQEAYGGNYLHNEPQVGNDVMVSYGKLGPIKHAQLVLAKRKEIPIGTRKRAMAIVTSAVGEPITTRTIQSA